MENNTPQNVCVKAEIVSAPDAKVGDVVAYCVGKPSAENCVAKDGECTCTVRQLIYVEFPITFTIQTEVTQMALEDNQPQQLPGPPNVLQLKAPTASHRPQRPLLFVLADWLRSSLFPRSGK
jgi:hypothetical protein